MTSMMAWLRPIVEDPRTERVVMSPIIINAVILSLETSKTVMASYGRLLLWASSMSARSHTTLHGTMSVA
jgi:hypothetical protein